MDFSDLFYRRQPAYAPSPRESATTLQPAAVADNIVRWFYAFRDFGGASENIYARFDTSANRRYLTITVSGSCGLRRRDLRTVRDEVGRRLADHYPALETPGDDRIIIASAVDRRRRSTDV